MTTAIVAIVAIVAIGAFVVGFWLGVWRESKETRKAEEKAKWWEYRWGELVETVATRTDQAKAGK